MIEELRKMFKTIDRNPDGLNDEGKRNFIIDAVEHLNEKILDEIIRFLRYI